jgi:putative Mn2+ efflux pump MntP
MPLIGLALGAPLGHAIGKAADYIAIGVLLAFGLYLLLGSEEREQRTLIWPSPSTLALVLLTEKPVSEPAVG